MSRGASYEGLAYAYLQTRDRRYLYPGIKDLGASISFSNVYQILHPMSVFPPVIQPITARLKETSGPIPIRRCTGWGGSSPWSRTS